MTFDIIENTIIKGHSGSSNSVVIPSNVLSIIDGNGTDYAFIEFRNIEFSLSFSTNSKITRIGKYSFNYCQKLSSIDFSNANSLKSIGFCAFYGCYALTSLKFPSSLELLDEYGSFANCDNINKITFPDDSKLQKFAGGTFWGAKITEFRVPSLCTYLNGETFAWTTVERFTVQKGNSVYKEYNSSIFSNDLKTLIVHRKAGELSLPPETTTIGLISLSNLKSDIKIRKNITIFNDLAFYSFNGKRITILGVFDSINARMFEACYRLIEVKFYNEVNFIKENSFAGSSKLRRIVLIYPVKSIVKTAFPDISKVCFYGEVSSIRAQINDTHINECKVFFNTCFNKLYRRSSISTSILPAIILLVYS